MAETQSSPARMRIAVVGETFDESRTVQRVRAMRALGHAVTTIATTRANFNYETRPGLMRRVRQRLRVPGDPADANRGLLRAVGDGADILWIEAAGMIRAGTLRRARAINPRIGILWYSEDDMMNLRHRSLWLDAALPLFDLWVTTKSFNTRDDEMPSRGVRNVLFVNNSCDPALHRPMDLDQDARARLGAPVSFVGSCEEPRARSLLHLAENGFTVRVWGNGWDDWVGRHPNMTVENRPIYNDDYVRAICASALNIGFLRKSNRDLQTCRSIEIPACGGFMVHERNDEICRLLREDKEAVYWSSDHELAEICGRWLADDAGRERVGRAGRERIRELELTHEANIRRMLTALENKMDASR